MTTKPILLAAIALAACGSSAADTSKPKPESVTDRFEREMMVRYHMHQNFDLLRGIERLLIRGKLEDAKRFASSIGSAPDDPAHGPWATHSVIVRERADAVAHATDVDDAIRKAAKLGAACGNCHGELAVSPEFKRHPKLPVDESTVPARMARHRWAADRLWEGVVGNSETPWVAGLDVLAAAPSVDVTDRGVHARRLQQLAKDARRSSPGPLVDRATKYGEILMVCASCHMARGDSR